MRKKRAAYEPHEEWIIQALKRIFKALAIRADDHHKIGKLPLEIDLVAVVGNKKALAKLPALFRYFQRYNIIEIKSEKTRFKVVDLQKLQAYGWHYMMKHAVESPKEVTLTALVHHLPRAVLKVLPEYDFEPAGKGIFCRRSHPVSYVISIEDSPDELLPEELQAFSNPERRKRVLLAALKKGGQSPIVEAIFNLYKSEVEQIMTREALAQKLVKIVGENKILALLDKQKVMKSLNKEDHLRALNKEDHLRALDKEDHLRALGEEGLLAALSRNEQLLKTAMTKLKPEKRRKIFNAVSRN
jgi:hypothetical protein